MSMDGTNLSSQLGKLLHTPPISIEILPGDSSLWLGGSPSPHAPFLFVDGHLGIPGKLSYKAYLEAVAHFRDVGPVFQSVNSALVESQAQTLIESSAVLLLVNNAHQSALNARKRLVNHGLLSPTLEFDFLNALLTLKQASKQSTLWQHRRWLLRRIHPPTSAPIQSHSRRFDAHPGDVDDTLNAKCIPASTFRAEFSAVSRACELYPRNYHAWAHRAICLSALIQSSDPAIAVVLAEERAGLRLWIERHVADYSAAYYLCRLERELERAGLSTSVATHTPLDVSGVLVQDTSEHALGLVRAYPSHEALWLYLRGTLKPEETTGADARALAEELLTGGVTKLGAAAWAHVIRFLAWYFREKDHIHPNSAVLRRIAAVAECGVSVSSTAELLSVLGGPS